MRSLWMASAALLMTAGIACAQTTPQGATNAPNEVPDGAAAGKTAPNSGTTTMAPGNAAPAPQGAINAPMETPPGAAPGKTASAPMKQHKMKHHWKHDEDGKMKPPHGGPEASLKSAKMAMEHHDYARAQSDLSHAETLLLTRSVDQGSGMSPDQSPAVHSIEQARKALRAHDTQGAMSATDAAMHAAHKHHGQMSPQGGMAAGGASSNTLVPNRDESQNFNYNQGAQHAVQTPTSSQPSDANAPSVPQTDGASHQLINGQAPQNAVTAPTTANPQMAPTAPNQKPMVTN
ncbi:MULTISPECIES: hypothetical protein [unclassified Acidocella]|uniref:hypothetical protein n=1 Tax=unclassified Acidocella TaxID=2648610 RepID=UPI00034CDBA4|nr:MULTISPECIES: hypothetical protein [unclassified Acidocella]WBO60797.1 hypothetical protein GT370_08670 [Acidocella sp. MX-AZ03]